MTRLVIICFLLFLSLTHGLSGHAASRDVRIGVLAIRGPDDALMYWQQVADHLNVQVPERHFVIVPHPYKTMGQAVADGQLDFVVASPSEYIEFEVKYGASRIAGAVSRAVSCYGN